MKHFNEKLELEIGTDHSFLRVSVDNLNLYKCQGESLQHHIFFGGIIKCHQDSPIPPPILADINHAGKCEGKFYRVFEINRTLNNNVESHYVVHKTIQNPIAAEANAKSRQMVNVQPREVFDITEDIAEVAVPKVVTTAPLINLDDAEFSEHRKKITRKIVEVFKSQSMDILRYCPLCLKSVAEYGGLRPHLDLC